MDVEAGAVSVACAEAVAGRPPATQQALVSPQGVRKAAKMQRRQHRRCGRVGAARILETIIDAVEEPFARGALAEFVQAANSDLPAKLEIAISRLRRLVVSASHLRTSDRVRGTLDGGSPREVAHAAMSLHSESNALLRAGNLH